MMAPNQEKVVTFKSYFEAELAEFFFVKNT